MVVILYFLTSILWACDDPKDPLDLNPPPSFCSHENSTFWLDDEGIKREFGIYRCHKWKFHHVYAMGYHILTGESLVLSYTMADLQPFSAHSPTLFREHASPPKAWFNFVGKIEEASSLLFDECTLPKLSQPRFFLDSFGKKREFGLYQRRLDKLYHIYAVGYNSSSKEKLVFYQSMHGPHLFWVRPFSSFYVRSANGFDSKPGFQFVKHFPKKLPGFLPLL